MTDVCVVGLGKIGLPLACAIARGGHRVRGADIDERAVAAVNAAIEPFPGEAGLADALTEVVTDGRLTATTTTQEAVRQSSVVIIVVPLVVDEAANPDFRAMDAATTAVAEALVADTLVCYETTLPVGTTRHRFEPALRAGSSLGPDDAIHVIHSPERVFSGRIFSDLRQYPKLVGGVDAESTRRGVEFYESFLEFDERDDLDRPNGVWSLGSVEAAEMAKLAETTYRDLNIAFANQLAMAAEALGVDVHAVISACNSQPFSHIHRPGVAVGGHCIPVYPHFLISSAPGMTLPALGREVNATMPHHVVDGVDRALGGLGERRVVVLGASYRGGVKEHAFSGVFALVTELEKRGASVTVVDPLYTDAELDQLGLRAHAAGDSADAVVLHTEHEVFGSLGPADFPGVGLVYDGRAFLDPAAWSPVPVICIGRPASSTPQE